MRPEQALVLSFAEAFEVARAHLAAKAGLRVQAVAGMPSRPHLVVAGLSARMLAQAASRDGWPVHALDLFGDADTRAASLTWAALGDADSLRIDASAVIDGLRAAREHARRQGQECLGWIAGGGFEASPQALQSGADVLPLLGNGADVVRAVRDPQRFFETLDAWGVDHPPVRLTPPDQAQGWLWKNPAACGGSHIRWATDGPACRHGRSDSAGLLAGLGAGQARVGHGAVQRRRRPWCWA